MGIDHHGKLKKLAIGDVQSNWEDVLTAKEDEEKAKPAKFVKVASSEHSILALDEIGSPYHDIFFCLGC